MEATQVLLPTGLEERLGLPIELRVRATWETFLELLPECEYRLEYDQREMISIMGFASEKHENLVIAIAFVLRTLLGTKDFQFYASNLALHIPGGQKRYFNADLTVVKGKSERKQLKGNMYAISNPVLLVEVLSPSTYSYDLANKASAYREIPSLQQLLFVDSESTHLISQSRQENSNKWTLIEYKDKADQVSLFNGAAFELGQLYANLEQ
ncbi:MAG TPA: Uma2 family endonuclease [Saprospiraceae bacterium]|nr:Uma2 family endonuclease [Saprospiraceae bacterium]HMQ83655.1 Uma2 family endonuclease [Saprospiraceae bacterium]